MLNVTLPAKHLRDVIRGLKVANARDLSILRCVRFDGNGDGTVTLTATDTEMTVTATVPGSCDEPVAIPHNLLASALKGTSGDATISHAQDGAQVRCSTGTHALRTLPIEEWPRRYRSSKFGEVKVGAVRLGRIASVTSRDDTRPVLTGVFVDDQRNQVVSTDSYRLAVTPAEVTVQEWPDTKPSMIVPGRFMQWAAKHAGPVATLELLTTEPSPDAPDTPRAEARITVETDIAVWTATATMISGEFPKYMQLIPDEFPNRLGLPANIVPALRGRSTDAPVIVEVADRRLTVGHQIHEQATSVLHAEPAPNYQDGKIGFNPAFLADGFEMVAPDSVGDVTIFYEDHMKPTVMVGAGVYYILMPVRAGDGPAPRLPGGPHRVTIPTLSEVNDSSPTTATEKPRRTSKSELVAFLRQIEPILPDDQRQTAKRLLVSA